MDWTDFNMIFENMINERITNENTNKLLWREADYGFHDTEIISTSQALL